jgi:hypothetical protein
MPVVDARGGFYHFGRRDCMVADGAHPGGEKEHVDIAAVPILQAETRVGHTGRGVKIDRERP